MKQVGLLTVVVALAVAAFAGEPKQHDDKKSCPMHDEHMKQQQGDEHYQGVLQRGEKGMGFDQLATTHHFRVAENGGAIEVTANNASDSQSVANIRSHLQHIAKVFAKGDFSIPMFVHDRTPPGVETMKKMRGEITYTYEELDRGARVVIATRNPDALKAVHEFLRFQIVDHRTGDSH